MAERLKIADRYVLGRLVGEGGMGSVHLATDVLLDRRVAVKLVRDANLSARGVELALREARTAASLNHPNIVTVHDAGVWEGTPYLVLEYLEGNALRLRIERRDVPLADRLRWLRDIASGLAAAHEAGLVHRDVKPDNVFVTRDGIVKIIDFGIARPAIVPEEMALSVSGQVVGTPLYMAPEQLRGEAPTPAVDQFAWGIVAYEVCAYERPWGTPDNLAALILAYERQEPEPLRARTPNVPPEVEAIVLRALGKLAADRHPSMREIAQRLGALLASGIAFGSEPTVASGPRSPLAATSTPSPDARDRRPRRIIDVPLPVTTTDAAREAYALALASLRDSNWGRAFELLTEAHRIAPDAPAITLRFAIVGGFESRLTAEEIRRLLSDVALRRGQLAHSDRALLRLFEANLVGRDELERVAEDVLSKFPRDAEIILLAASTLRGAVPAPKILALYEQALAVDPEYGDAWHAKARTLLHLDREEEAIEALGRGLAVVSHGADLAWERALLHARRGDLAAWEADARHAATISNQPLPYDTWIGAVLARGRGVGVARQIVRKKNAGVSETQLALVLDGGRLDVFGGELAVALERLSDVDVERLSDDPSLYRWALLGITTALEVGEAERARSLARTFFEAEAIGEPVMMGRRRIQTAARSLVAMVRWRAGDVSAEEAIAELGVGRDEMGRPACKGDWLMTFSYAFEIPGALEAARATRPGSIGALTAGVFVGPLLGAIDDPTALRHIEAIARGIFCFEDPIGYGQALLMLAERLEQDAPDRARAAAERVLAMWGRCEASRTAAAARALLARLSGPASAAPPASSGPAPP